MTIQEIVADPSLLTSEHFLKSGEKVVFRALDKNDPITFGLFLESLSETTRGKFGPHPLSSEEAMKICVSLNFSEMLRMILTNQQEEIIGYIILSFQFRDSQLSRYEDYKISINKDRDICIAPVVADQYQGSGAGSVMLSEAIRISRSLGVKYIILWQGTQLTNTRAIRFYEKFGFKESGKFERYGNNNVDMTLTL